jgi:8-oxo-dGTP pyrophosphatase MutT (NUDIX family)
MAEADELSGCFVGAAIIDLYQKDGIPRCLVIPSAWVKRPDKAPDIKLPGGMHKVDDKDFEATLRREILAETGLRVRLGARLPPPLSYKLEEQWKYLFLLSRRQCKGSLRRGEISDGDSVLGEPRWVTCEELERDLFRTHRFWLPAIKTAMQRPLR